MVEATALTDSGLVRGVETTTGLVFRGIPFAESPAGSLRHCPPRPPIPWTGVRDASCFGAICPQVPPSQMGGLMMREDEPTSEDCLHLNVWTPALDDARRPTMVWFHGGGFALGSGSAALYNGESFARDGVVFVSVNYRLHALGFLYLDGIFDGAEGTGNLGTLDQVAALRWVHDNIANFGGDPENVTIAGQSAGGMSVATLLATPSAVGLFRRAIAQSGAGHHALSIDAARRVTTRLLEILAVEPGDWDALRSVPVERIVDEAMRLSQFEAGSLLGDERVAKMSFLPVVDGVVRAARPIDLIELGHAAGVDLLVGSTLDESRIFLFSPPPEVQAAMPDPDVEPYLAASGRSVDEVTKIYAAERPGSTIRDVLAAIETDHQFTIPAIRLAEAQLAHHPNVFLYRFSWPTPVLDGRLGACHILDVPFVFEVLAESVAFVGEAAPPDLASAMHQAWVRFVASGDPNGAGLPTWPRYELDRRPVMDLSEHRMVLDDPGAVERRLWEGIR